MIKEVFKDSRKPEIFISLCVAVDGIPTDCLMYESTDSFENVECDYVLVVNLCIFM